MKEKIFGTFGKIIVWREIVSHPLILKLGKIIASFVIAFFMSQAVCFENISPFGIALLAASNVGVGGLATLLGCLAGYFFGQVDFIPYITIAILLYTTKSVFKDVKKSYFNSFVVFGISFAIKLVIAFADGLNLSAFIFLITEVILIMGCTFFFQIALNKTKSKTFNSFGKIVLMSAILYSFAAWSIMGGIHPARFVAAIIAITVAYQGGVGQGAVCGLFFGLVMDLNIGFPYFSMVYGFSGLISGVFKQKNKLITAVLFILLSAIAALWAGSMELRIATILETFIASIIFMILPARAQVIDGFNGEIRDESAVKIQQHTRKKLEQTAKAFQVLHDTVSTAFNTPQNDQNIATVMEKTSERLCKKCKMRGFCWTRESHATNMALSNASGHLNERGMVDESDFPSYFSSRCIKFQEFISITNDEMNIFLQRRQYKTRMRDSRVLVSRQYEEISRILGSVAQEVSQGVTFDSNAEFRLAKMMLNYDMKCEVGVYKDVSGIRKVEIEGKNVNTLLQEGRELFLRRLAVCVGFHISAPEHVKHSSGERLIFSEAELHTATLGVATHKKNGESVSGDSYSFFKTADGKIFFILSDGMGTGEAAQVCSNDAIKLLERFLHAGIQPDIALSTLNSALILKEEGGFATVDLMVLDLITGEAKFYKQGASPSYIRHNQKICRINGKNLPSGVGIGDGPFVDMTAIVLNNDEMALLLSDGVVGLDGDDWLISILANDMLLSAKELSSKIIEKAIEHHGSNDDMTVLTVFLGDRALENV